MRRAGFNESEIGAALAEMNRTRCTPPLDDAEVATIARSIGRYEPAEALGVVRSGPPLEAADGDAETLVKAVRMDTVQIQKIDWLWRNRIPRGAITVVTGEEGIGKSTMLCAIAAAVTTGKGREDFDLNGPGCVLWLSAEEDLARVLKPRLIDAGADCSRVFAIGEPFTFDDRGLLALREQIADHDPALVVIDPIFAYLSGDANRGNDSRRLTNELKHITEQAQAAMLLVRHIGKAKGMGDPRAAGLASIEWRAAARSELLVGADPNDRNKRAVTQTKNNYGAYSTAAGYVIESDPTAISGARFYWTGESDLTAERILSPIDNDEESKLSHREAEDFLREALADGERPAKEIQTEAKQCGISDSTLNRTKRRLGVVSRQEGGGFSSKGRIWYWSLPPSDVHEAPSDVHMLTSDHLTVNGRDKSTYSNGLPSDVHMAENEHLTGEVEHLTGTPDADELHREALKRWRGDLGGREDFEI